MYAKSRKIYLEKNYAEAINSFQQLKNKHPDHKLIPNAHYWIAASHYKMKNYEEALAGYGRVIDAYPKSNKVPDAYWMRGNSLLMMHKKNEAMKTFNTLIKKFPKTEAAGKAEKTLKRLGAVKTHELKD